MRLLRIAAALGWIAIAVGVLRFLLVAPLFGDQLAQLISQMKLTTFSGGFYVFSRLIVEDMFFCIQSVVLGFLLLMFLRTTNHSISPFKSKGSVES
jgi:hypothetical protein